MKDTYQIGDLVHVPQAVHLIDCPVEADPQLTIPLRVEQTQRPRVGIVTYVSSGGYVRIFCDGAYWAVKDSKVYKLG